MPYLLQNDYFSYSMKSLKPHFETKILTQTNSKVLIIFSEKIENIKKNFTIT